MSNTKSKTGEVKKTVHQKFEMRTMLRSEIREAPYNPRIITDASKKKLRGKIKAVGLLQPLVLNQRTGNLVSGHQRLATLDGLERWKPGGGKDYHLDMSVIDVDESTEKEMVVFFNNPSAMGEWNLELLAEMNLVDGIDFVDMGFEKFDIDMLFDGDTRFSQIFVDDEEIGQTGEKLKKVKAARAESIGKMKEKNSAEFYFVVVCRDQPQKDELLRAIGVQTFEQFVEGAYLLENLRRGPLGRMKNPAAPLSEEPPG